MLTVEISSGILWPSSLIGYKLGMSRSKDLGGFWRPKSQDAPVAAPTPNGRRQKKRRWSKRSRSDRFYSSSAWLTLRYKALKLHGAKCQCCGSENGPMHVDHIKPRYLYPYLELQLTNLQVLCEACNLGKGCWDQTDWRGELTAEQREHMRSI